MQALSGWTAHVDRRISDGYPCEHRPWLDESWFRVRSIGALPFNASQALIGAKARGEHCDRVAVIGSDEVWTYRQLAAQVDGYTHTLRHELDLIPGNAIVFQCENSPAYAAALLATWRAGGVAVLCSPFMSAAEVGAIAASTSPKAIVTDGLTRCTDARHIALTEFAQQVERWLGQPSECTETAPTDPALLLFTSGSTGQPKATLHFHRDLIVAPRTYGSAVVSMQADDIVAGSPSLSFAYGIETLLLMPLLAGASTILQSGLHAAQLVRMLAADVTVLFTTPTIISSMLETQPSQQRRRLRLCVSAGESITAELATRWQAAMGAPVANGLGLSEFNAFVLGARAGATPLGALGRAVPGFEAMLLDDNDQPIERPDVLGRLAVRGPTGCRYFSNPKEQAQRVRNGWTLTGDLCERDSQGHFWYRGRFDDLIVRGGINVAPLEIERALLQSPLVKESCVVGRFDPTLQTTLIVAHVVLRETAESPAWSAELRQWLAARLAPHKVPDAFVRIERLPRNSNGKVARSVLRAPAAAMAPAAAASRGIS